MGKKETVEFVFAINCDRTKMEEFGDLWMMGLRMLQMARKHGVTYGRRIKARVNESPGAKEEREVFWSLLENQDGLKEIKEIKKAFNLK